MLRVMMATFTGGGWRLHIKYTLLYSSLTFAEMTNPHAWKGKGGAQKSTDEVVIRDERYYTLYQHQRNSIPKRSP